MFGNSLYPDEPSYEDFSNMRNLDPKTPAMIKECHYSVTSTSSIPPKNVRSSSGEDNSNNYKTLPPHATSIQNDPIKRRQRPQNGRSSISSVAHETYRRASQAASSVTKNLGWLAALWTWVVQEHGPGFLATCLASGLFVLALRHALVFPTSGPAIVFWAASETGQDIVDAWNQGKRTQALKRHVSNFNLTRHFGVGGVGGGVLTSFETGAWRLYGELLRGKGMEGWFDEVRQVDDVVSALWSGLPALEGVVVSNQANGDGTGGGVAHQPQAITVTVTFPGGRKGPTGGGKQNTARSNTTEKTEGGDDGKEQDENSKAVMRRLKMRGHIDMRSTMRKRAEAYFENFLAGRATIIGRALDDAHRFGELVESHLVAPVNSDDEPAQGFKTVGPEFHADVAAKFGQGSDKKGAIMTWKKDKFPEVTVMNRTNYILSYAGLHLTTRLLETHQSLYAAARPEPADFSANLKGQASSLLATSKPDTFSVLTDLRRAEEAEREFLKDLIAQSAYGPVLGSKKALPLKQLPLGWTKQPATLALDTLIAKAAELEGRLQSAGRNLAWLNERLAAQVAAETVSEFKPETSEAPTKVKDEDQRHLFYGDWSWSQTAQELVGSWGRGVEEVAKAVRWNEEQAGELLWKKREGGNGEDKGAAVSRWRVDNCAGASCYNDIVASRPVAIGDKKEKQGKSLKGWFWNKKNGGEEESAKELKAEGEAETREQKPLSGSGDGGKVTTLCGDDVSLAGKATCEKLCCGYSMHNEWADILMYGDKQFTYQDLYRGQPPEAALV